MKNGLQNILERFRQAARRQFLPLYFDRIERRWIFQSIVIGFVVWVVVFALKWLVHGTFDAVLAWVESAPSELLVLIPLALGALIVALLTQLRASTLYYQDSGGRLHPLNDVEGDGLERAISLYFSSEPSLEHTLLGEEGVNVRWRLPTFSLALRKFLATLATLGSGGSGGLEASVTLIGESLSAGLFKPRRVVEAANRRVGLLGRLWRWWVATDPDDLQTAQIGGIAAAITTLLGAPFAGAFFAVEVMYRRRPIIDKLIYAVIPSLIAYFLTNLATDRHSPIFEPEFLPNPPTTLRYYLATMAVAALIALVAIYFRRLRTRLDRWFHRLPVPVWQRHLLGALLTGMIALLVAFVCRRWLDYDHGLELVLGPGDSPIAAALAGRLTLWLALIALFAKLLATLITIGSGGSAGLLVPSIFFGAMIASAVASALEWHPVILVVPALAGSLVSIVSIPLAAMLFIVEVFGTPYLLPSLLILVMTSLLTHQNSIYRTQRERYDNRQIMPGYSVRRMPVPLAWAGKSLLDLRLRNRFEVNVIGVVVREAAQSEFHQYIQPNPDLERPLNTDDMLVVLGSDDRLDTLEHVIRNGGYLALEPDHEITIEL